MRIKILAILRGIGSILELNPPPPKNPIAVNSDLERLRSDWYNIGKDMSKVMTKIEKNGKRTANC